MPPHLIKYFEKKTPVIDFPSALIRHRSAALRPPGCGCAAGPRAAPSESLLNIHREASSPLGSSKFSSLGSLGAFCALLHRFPPAPRAALGAPALRSGPERFCLRTAPPYGGRRPRLGKRVVPSRDARTARSSAARSFVCAAPRFLGISQ